MLTAEEVQHKHFIQGASRKTDVMEQVEGVEAWVGGNSTRQAMPFQLTSCRSG
jgi:hypothetical protein